MRALGLRGNLTGFSFPVNEVFGDDRIERALGLATLEYRVQGVQVGFLPVAEAQAGRGKQVWCHARVAFMGGIQEAGSGLRVANFLKIGVFCKNQLLLNLHSRVPKASVCDVP